MKKYRVNIDEGLIGDTPLLELEKDDDELSAKIDKAIESGRKVYENVRLRADVNRKYWKGDQLDTKQLKESQSKAVDNILFRDLETMLPIVTKNTPAVKFISSNKEFDQTMKKIMFVRWEVYDKMLDKSRKSIRANFLDLLGAMKARYDEEVGDIVWEFVNTDHFVLDPDADSPENCNFIAEFIADQTVKEITERFPKKKKELLELLEISEENDGRLGNRLRYCEFWTPEWVAWKYKGLILDKVKNPHWDWGQEMLTDEMGEQKQVSYNLFKKPTMPYIFLQSFNLGGSFYSDTSLFEQSLSEQDTLNKRKRQIGDNADDANGILVGSGDYISKDEFSKIEPEPNLKIWVDSGDARMAVSRVLGNPLHQYVYQDMIHSESAIDNIFGIHAITRGSSSGEKTATQDVLQQRQDYGRIDDFVKSFEDFAEQYYQMTFQLMLTHYIEPHIYSFEDEDDLSLDRESMIKAYSFSVERVQDVSGEQEVEKEGEFKPPTIMVLRGSTLPTDDIAKRSEAINLWAQGGISPIDLYKALDWPDAMDAAKRLSLFKTNPMALFPEAMQGEQPNQGQPSQGAVEDMKAIQEGQDPGVNPEVQQPQTAGPHIEAHNQMMDSSEFQQMQPQLQQLFINHLKAEIEAVKQIVGQGEQNAV